jgi:hypothetical protein
MENRHGLVVSLNLPSQHEYNLKDIINLVNILRKYERNEQLK